MIKKNFFLATLFSVMVFFSGCKEKKDNQIIFGLSADYPPFEFYQNNTLKGFDVELATLIAQELKKEAKFEDMQFNAILAALQHDSIDAALSTITITEERKKSFDFSDPYYAESLSIVYLKKNPLKNKESLRKKKIGCQLGTTMEIWLKKHIPDGEIVLMNSNNQAVEALKTGHIQGVFIDSTQAVAFVEKNPELGYSFIAQSDEGYGVAMKKGSPLKEDIDRALKKLKDKGVLETLKKKWLNNKPTA